MRRATFGQQTCTTLYYYIYLLMSIIFRGDFSLAKRADGKEKHHGGGKVKDNREREHKRLVARGGKLRCIEHRTAEKRRADHENNDRQRAGAFCENFFIDGVFHFVIYSSPFLLLR
mgnify:CR=1 FL=1